MTTAISSSSIPAQTFCLPYEWMDDLCKVIYKIALDILQKIGDCFSDGLSQINRQTREVITFNSRNIIAFYRGTEPNVDGSTLHQILNWDDERLETVHNYIQWLFPLTTPTPNNPTAPVLDPVTIEVMRLHRTVKNNMLMALRRMLRFYGLQMDETTRMISRAPNFNERAAVWLHNPLGHHNFLRISRIIQSLYLFGLSEHATALLNVMLNISEQEGKGIIPHYTMTYWSTIPMLVAQERNTLKILGRMF